MNQSKKGILGSLALLCLGGQGKPIELFEREKSLSWHHPLERNLSFGRQNSSSLIFTQLECRLPGNPNLARGQHHLEKQNTTSFLSPERLSPLLSTPCKCSGRLLNRCTGTHGRPGVRTQLPPGKVPGSHPAAAITVLAVPTQQPLGPGDTLPGCCPGDRPGAES